MPTTTAAHVPDAKSLGMRKNGTWCRIYPSFFAMHANMKQESNGTHQKPPFGLKQEIPRM